MNMKVIPDKAEVALAFPDKAYMGTFGRSAHFDAVSDPAGVTLKLERRDDQKRVVEVHLHHGLFADILEGLATSIAGQDPIDDAHRQALQHGARHLLAALGAKR